MTSVTTTDGTTIAYDDEGRGRPLVLVHGITESRRSWDPLLDALASRWRVVRIDLRGHGESDRRAPYDPVTMAGDVAAVVEALGLGEPLLVGHSMGGVVVSAYGGAGHPARGIVNVDQALALAGFKDALAPIEALLRDPATFPDAIAAVFSVLDGPLPADERRRLDGIASPEPDVVLGVWEPVFALPAEELDALATELLRGIGVPYLALHGSDPGPEYGAWLRERVAGAQLEVWPECGHYPQLVEPARFVTRLERFDDGL